MIANLFLTSLFLMFCFSLHGFCAETDTITSGYSIRDPDFLVSSGQVFKLGFFTPENTTNRYLAIYYVVSENTTIWIANRDNPLTDNSGTVNIFDDGNLILINGQNETIWSTNAMSAPVNTTTAQILDTGNLVLRDVSTRNLIWDSFSHPTNVFMPTMRLYENMSLSSWKTPSDPGVGNFSSAIESRYIPQAMTWKNGQANYRSGPWNGNLFLGVKELYNGFFNPADGLRMENDSRGVYITSSPLRFLTKTILDLSGSVTQTVWNDENNKWEVTWASNQNECDIYGKCGPFGVCNPLINSSICSCLEGFEPANRNEWGSGNWTSGCTRTTQLHCDRESQNFEDVFFRMPFIKLPDFAQPFPNRLEDECRTTCLRNCSCLAYAHDSNIGCMLWNETLIDIQQFDGVGPIFYIRLASSDNNNDRRLVIIIPVVVGVSFLSVSIFIAWCWMAKKKAICDQKVLETLQLDSTTIVLKDESDKVNIEELPLFTFKTLADATNQFHDANMLGKGGFGYVYKGTLANGKDIAVKRLSANSGQGGEEFRNEAIVISKVQHKNLVKLLGCCVEGEEKILVYEYMSNKSLDICLFDPTHSSHKLLDWMKRFSIIEGIGRGLVYLHVDSRLKIIHRDLKPSNVLLDMDWKPKISDFGMARIFGGNQDQAHTTKVVGTYGYMAPEYAIDGQFSEKSDVYSFGVLMLEILSGQKNTHYYNQEWSSSLLGCAWKKWNEGNCIEFSDQTIANASFEGEIVRCIHIALLCVQEFPKDRPTVQIVVSMLNHEILDLPLPHQPLFAEKWDRGHVRSTQPTSQNGYSVNELTISVLDGR